jgi:uncharacterized membrane protein YkgB
MATAATDLKIESEFQGLSNLTAGLGQVLTTTGVGVLRYGLVGILLFFGSFKFSGTEAHAIQPLISNSPLMSWMYSIFSAQAVSNIIGTTEIIFALLIALRAFNATLSAIGSIGAIGMLMTTLSFLLTTPGAWIAVSDFPLPVTTGTGSFLIKDVFLLGGAIIAAGEALLNRHRR